MDNDKVLKALAAMVAAIDTSYETPYEAILHGFALGYVARGLAGPKPEILYSVAIDILSDNGKLTPKDVTDSLVATANLMVGSL